MNFGQALDLLKEGKRVNRKSWSSEKRSIYLVSGSQFKVNRAPLDQYYEIGTEVSYLPHIDIQYANDTMGIWMPTHDDVLAEDWEIA
jgi:hypothetical protein